MSVQNPLNNFYQSVAVDNPRLATLMHEDVMTVTIHGRSTHKSSRAQEAADRLRQQSCELPEALRRVLEGALTDLGYS